jgi:hypothetical protein
MNHLIATLFIIFIVVGATTAILVGWRGVARIKEGPRWRSIVGVISLALVTLAALLFAAYVIRNAMIGGDRNGGPTSLRFIRSGNYLSLLGIVASLMGKGKGRWATFIGGCLMLFLWFSEGISL